MAHFTTSDGVRIYYESHGTGEPLLLAYGIGGNAGMWQPNIEALSARHRLILWEPRGHARSESPADPTKVTFGHWVLDLHDLMSHLGLGPRGRGRPLPRRRASPPASRWRTPSGCGLSSWWTRPPRRACRSRSRTS